MRLHRFFVKDKINPKEKVTLRYFDYDSILNQWQKVFRYLAGSRVVLFDGSGFDYLAIIEKMDSAGAVLRVLETSKADKVESSEDKSIKKAVTSKASKDNKTESSKVRVTIIMSLIKNDNFDLVLQKATELGVSQVVPIITDRTIKKDLNMSRSQRILVEASEQCGRSEIPVIDPVKKLGEALKELESIDKKKVGVFVCNQNGLNISEILKKKNSYTDLVFLIGPEGGWSPKEIKLFEDAKIKSVRINQNVLRAETAAIALLAVVLQ